MMSSACGKTVVLEDVHKSFGRTEVLRGISLEIDHGEKVALIGPSGSGKTTILRIIAGLETVSSGTVQVGGTDLSDLASLKGGRQLRRLRNELYSGLGVVFQQYNLFPHMSALRNVTEPLVRVHGIEKGKAKSIAESVLERVGLTTVQDHKPSQLSGGQRQRVAIARALAVSPALMLFDEITSALDPELVTEVLDLVNEIAMERDRTMVLVTHEIGFAAHVADRIVMFADGVIVEQGSPTAILGNAASERTRAFLSGLLDFKNVL